MNRDHQTVEGFGDEWSRFDQRGATPGDLEETFASYFALFPWGALPTDAVGFDLGCGSGRWAGIAAGRVGTLVCVDPSAEALDVAGRNATGCHFLRSAAGELPFRAGSMDFAYSLGVLHHTPDPAAGLADAVGALKLGAPMLVYLYYALDNRPAWFRLLWQGTDLVRRVVSRSPYGVRYVVTQVIAGAVYLPLARLAAFLERRGREVDRLPLSAYRNRSFYIMRNDALDRFGTRLEKRFTRSEVAALLQGAGLERITVDGPPYWCAIGYRRAPADPLEGPRIPPEP